MSPFHTMAFIVVAGTVSLILFSHDLWGKILGAIVFSVFILVWLIVYCSHSIKKPELLQSETYRLEMHKIEAGMIEDKSRNVQKSEIETIKTNLIEIISDNQEGDYNVS